jgi:hypothetical protein
LKQFIVLFFLHYIHRTQLQFVQYNLQPILSSTSSSFGGFIESLIRRIFSDVPD